MHLKTIIIKYNLLTILAIAVILSGCGQSAQKAVPQQSSQSDEKGKVPEQLKSVESNIEKIFYTLNGPAVVQKEDKSSGGEAQQSSSSGQNENKKDGQGGQDENKGQDKESKQGSTQSQGQGQGQSKQQAAEQDPWEKITPIINEMHYSWNSLMPLTSKNGANKALIDNFSSALNNLTNSIVSKNKTNTLMAASHLYSFIPDLYALSKAQTSPEVKRIRYYTRNAILNSINANWDQADSDIKSLKESWSLYKNNIPKEQQENISKLDFSFYELEKVIQEKNQPLSDIKGRVSMSNIEDLEKASEKK